MNMSNTWELLVGHMDWLAPDVCHVCLQAESNRLPDYLPGQYLKLHLEDCSARAYSIASAPESGLLEIQIKTTGDNQPLIQSLRSKSKVMIDIPHGCCRLPDNERNLLMVAGGTGVSQMRSIILSSIARNESRSMWLYWGVDSSASLYLDHELRELSTQHPRFHYVPVLATAENRRLDRIGYPHEYVLRDFESLSDFEIIISGSKKMAIDLYRDFSSVGVEQNRMHCDWLDILRSQNIMQ